MFLPDETDQIGSRLWTLKRRKRTTETLRLYEDYTREALQWLLDDGVADTIKVSAAYDENGFAQGSIIISKPAGETRFSVAWERQELKRG